MAARKGPLRRILTGDELPLREGGPRVRVHVLECGHFVPYDDDSGVYRRRCSKCRIGSPPDVKVADYGA